MKKGSMGRVVHILVIAIVMLVAGLLSYFFTPKAFAQTVTTPYWCGSYWSNQPCAYNNQYYNPNAQYQNYQYYYPQNYYGYNPYGYNQYNNYGYYGNQYYYPAPSCNISYSNTSNPNYWNGTMYNQAIQLTWSSSYVTSAYISNVGSVSQSGTRVIYPTGYTQYTLTVYGPGGTNTCTTYYQPQQYYQPSYQQMPAYYWNQYNYNYGYNYGYPYAW